MSWRVDETKIYRKADISGIRYILLQLKKIIIHFIAQAFNQKCLPSAVISIDYSYTVLCYKNSSLLLQNILPEIRPWGNTLIGCFTQMLHTKNLFIVMLNVIIWDFLLQIYILISSNWPSALQSKTCFRKQLQLHPQKIIVSKEDLEKRGSFASLETGKCLLIFVFIHKYLKDTPLTSFDWFSKKAHLHIVFHCLG